MSVLVDFEVNSNCPPNLEVLEVGYNHEKHLKSRLCWNFIFIPAYCHGVARQLRQKEMASNIKLDGKTTC